MAAAGRVVFLEQGVAPAVELLGLDLRLLAQRAVEHRRRLHPLAFQPDIGIAVIGEDVGAHGVAQLGRRQVVLDVGIADPGRDAEMPAAGDHRQGLLHAPAAAAPDQGAGLVFRPVDRDGIGRIEEIVPDGVEQVDRLAEIVGGVAGVALRIILHGGIAEIHVPGRCQKGRRLAVGDRHAVLRLFVEDKRFAHALPPVSVGPGGT